MAHTGVRSMGDPGAVRQVRVSPRRQLRRDSFRAAEVGRDSLPAASYVATVSAPSSSASETSSE
jgi:hypothetical protein